MAVKRENFLHDALKVWYEHSNANAQAIIANNKTSAESFARSNPEWVAAPHTREEWLGVAATNPSAMAYYQTILAQQDSASYGLTIAALTTRDSLTPEMYEVILEDFRGRTAVSGPDGKVVSLAESIYSTDVGAGSTTFSGKISFGEAFLTGSTKKSKIGVLAPRNPNTLTDYTKTTESFRELTRAIAIFDYNNELQEKEIPHERERASQMNAIKAVNDTFSVIPETDADEALRSAVERHFAPFAEAGRTLSSARLVEIKNVLASAYASLVSPTFGYYTDKKGVEVDHLIGDVQVKFEEIYNSLFGMSNLRDRNPEVVPVYPPLSNIVVNEIARRIQNGTLTEGNWLETVKSNPLFPAGFTDRAVDHAEKLLEATAAFGMVYEYTDEAAPPIIRKPEDVAATLDANPNARTYGDMVTGVIVDYFKSDVFPEAKREEFAKLTASQQTVVAQLIAREMTTRSSPSSDGRGIHSYLATQALPASIQTLVEDGTFPNFSDLNKFAMTLMLTADKKPDVTILAGVHDQILTKAQEAGIENFTLGGTYEQTDEEGRISVVTFGEVKEGEVKIGDRTQPGVAEAFANTYGSKFYHSGVYGTYGVVEQNQQAIESARVLAETEKIRKDSLTPHYDGYKYKLLSKSDYYKQKFNEYYQMYMSSGGPQQYWSMLSAENARRSVICKDPTPVEEEVITEDPPVETPDSKIAKAFTKLKGMHTRLVERVVGSNKGIQYQNTEEGHSTLNFQAALVRNYNSKVANIVLKEVAALIEGKEEAEVASIIEGLSQPTVDADGKRVAPILPKGVTVSPDGQTVSFFGMTYSRTLDEENRPKVVAHYHREGAPVPQSTMITILTHDQAAVREIAPAYANLPANASVFTPTRATEKQLVNENSALLGFISDPTAGAISMLTPALSDPSATALSAGTLDRTDKTATGVIDKANDGLKIGDGMFTEDDVPTL